MHRSDRDFVQYFCVFGCNKEVWFASALLCSKAVWNCVLGCCFVFSLCECRFFMWFLIVFIQILHRGSINVVFGLSAKFAVQSIGQIVISCNISLFSDLT